MNKHNYTKMDPQFINDFISDRILNDSRFYIGDCVDDWSAVVQQCSHPAFEHMSPPFRLDFKIDEKDATLLWTAVKRGVAESEGSIRLKTIYATQCLSPRTRLDCTLCTNAFAQALLHKDSLDHKGGCTFWDDKDRVWYNLDTMTWSNGQLVVEF